MQAAPAQAARVRWLPSTLDVRDIEGTQPGWRPHPLFVGQPRDSLRVSDICGPAQRHRIDGAAAGAAAHYPARSASAQDCSALPVQRCAIALPLSARDGTWPPGKQEAAPEVGVAHTVDWQRRRAEAKMQQGAAVRQARQAADAAIAAAAAKAAAAAASSTPVPWAPSAGGGSGGSSAAAMTGLAGMMRSLRAYDRDGSGRVQVRVSAGRQL